MQEREEPQNSSAARWSRRVGVGAFLFFLVKGLLWLIVPALLTYLAMK